MALQELNVYNLPQYVSEQELAGSVVVVIDLLRASTTICQALASGAREVVPFLEVDEALTAAEADPNRGDIVLGGERGGRLIPGFDLGNSPAEYTRTAVAGKRVFITTTNGTRALQHARLAKRVLVGAAVNLSAVAVALKDEPRIDILCAGTDGQETREDVLAAGGLVTAFLMLLTTGACSESERSEVIAGWNQISESSKAAGMLWSQMVVRSRDAGYSTKVGFATELRKTQGGRNLLEIGFDRDLDDCAEIDRLSVVPELDIQAWRIRPV